jgi:hypothetical protein
VADDQVTLKRIEDFLSDLSRRTANLEATQPKKPHAKSAPWRPVTGMSLRATLTIILVLGLMATVVGCIIAGKSAGDVVQYATPINTLASLAVGYWFGTEKTPPG